MIAPPFLLLPYGGRGSGGALLCALVVRCGMCPVRTRIRSRPRRRVLRPRSGRVRDAGIRRTGTGPAGARCACCAEPRWSPAARSRGILCRGYGLAPQTTSRLRGLRASDCGSAVGLEPDDDDADCAASETVCRAANHLIVHYALVAFRPTANLISDSVDGAVSGIGLLVKVFHGVSILSFRCGTDGTSRREPSRRLGLGNRAGDGLLLLGSLRCGTDIHGQSLRTFAR